MNNEHEGMMPDLCDADAALLDQLVECGFEPSRIEGLDAEQQQRLDRLVAMFGLLDAYPVEPLSDEDRDTLVHATLARIDREEDGRAERLRFDPGASAGGSRFGAFELVAVAAIIILGLSVIFPMMNAARDSSTRSTQRNNLAQIGGGLFNFADANEGWLPESAAAEWDPVFGEETSRLQMGPLVEGGYLDPAKFNFKNPGWSFQTQPKTHTFQVAPEQLTVWIGDRNPTLDYVEISGDHHTITVAITWSPSVLLSDGSVLDLPDHSFNGDDMRLPDPECRNLDHADVFLSHPVAH